MHYNLSVLISSLKEMETKIINELLDCVKNGKTPQNNSKDYINCYSIVYDLYDFADWGFGKELIEYHNQKIEKASSECYEKIKDLLGIDFIDSFILYTKRLNKFFYSMSKLFKYISTNVLKSTDSETNARIYKQDDITEFSMEIYKKYFFDKLQDKLFNILNEFLIKEERRGKLKYREKIMYTVKIITDMDKSSPKLVSVTDTSFNWEEELDIYNKPKSPLINQEKWYNSYKDATIKYVKEKAENDKKKYQIGEYIKIELKYINEEIERQNYLFNDQREKSI
jgi:hypothetical protein